MIDLERFVQLAGAVAAGEASPQEQAELEAALAAEPAWVIEWRETQAIDTALRRALPMAATPTSMPAMPDAVRARLEEVRRDAVIARRTEEDRWTGVATSDVAAFAPAPDDAPAGVHLGTAGGRPDPFRPTRLTLSWLALAACLVLLLGVAALRWKQPQATSPNVIASVPPSKSTQSEGDQAGVTRSTATAPPPTQQAALPPEDRTGNAHPAVVASAPLQGLIAPFDPAAAKARLSEAVINTAAGFLTKGTGGDPVVTRAYTADAVIITRMSGARVERPYVVLPLRFQEDSDEISYEDSRLNLASAAQTLKELATAGATFGIEVHTGAGGDTQRSLELAKQRAVRVQAFLIKQGVSSDGLARAEGFAFDPERFREPDSGFEGRRRQGPQVLLVKVR